MSKETPVLEAKGLGIQFGGLKAVNDFSISIGKSELVGLIGPNGAGKTTVFNLLTGVYQPTEGTYYLNGEKMNGKQSHQVVAAGIARTFQNIRLFKKMTVLENVIGKMPGHWNQILRLRNRILTRMERRKFLLYNIIIQAVVRARRNCMYSTNVMMRFLRILWCQLVPFGSGQKKLCRMLQVVKKLMIFICIPHLLTKMVLQ